MIRPVFTEFALFLIPFIAYAVFLLVTRRGVFDWTHWPLGRIAWLMIVALLLMIGSFVVLTHFGADPGSTYVPAYIDENGNLVPGHTE